MKAAILAIGTELLIGQTIDTNSAWIGEHVTALGLTITQTLAIADDKPVMIDAIKSLSKDVDYLFITGGLGPTKDDITKDALAEVLGVEMKFDQSTNDRIVSYFVERNLQISELHKAQCYFPIGIQLLENTMGTAPGMLMQHQNCQIISMPGVPYEMKEIMKGKVLPLIESNHKRQPYYQKTIHTAGIPESSVADLIEATIDNLPESIDIAYLPSLGTVKVRVSAIGQESELQVKNAVDLLVDKLQPYVYGYDGLEIQEAVQQLMIDRGLTLATAESCTGGYISHLITSISGSSGHYNGGIVAYANEVKINQLNVNSNTITQYGAVSEEVVKEMVIGCIDSLSSDIAIAVSGIAGPTGGTELKPVGTIWICVGNKERQFTRKFGLTKNRIINIRYSSRAALILLRKFLLDQ